MGRIDQSQEFETPKHRCCHSKHYKGAKDDCFRVGRLYRAEAKYRNHRTHVGKGVTLRTHRKGK